MNPEYGALAPVMVPEVYPRVPLLCVHRNPVFPRFVKMLEVCNTTIYMQPLRVAIGVMLPVLK